jgi:fatty acid desaturase
MTKYRFNQLLCIVNIAIITSLFTLLIREKLPTYALVLVFIAIGFCQHYFLNIVHIASHFGMSKVWRVNSLYGNIAAIFGGVTFADFRTTHMLHHKNVHNLPENDPDHWITTSGPVWTIPFKIFYHDVYFWRNSLWKQRGAWRGYIINRSVQVGFVASFSYYNMLEVWQYFWLLPLLIVGFLNGLFLFYFPHYSTKLEHKWREAAKKNAFQQLVLTAIDISRYFHEKHHDSVQQNTNYFPVFAHLSNTDLRAPFSTFYNSQKYVIPAYSTE